MRDILSFINGEWVEGQKQQTEIINPATLESLGKISYCSEGQAHQSAGFAVAAGEGWRRTPAVERIQYLFKLKDTLEKHLDELARLITMENGKTLGESIGELRRAIENVEVACGIPTLSQGVVSEDIARGIDELMIRQPVGVCAIIAPFNFPSMIPFWFFPYALALGNTIVIKPSERTPLTMTRIMELIEPLGFPQGVINLVHGGKEVVDTLVEDEIIKAISFVGSTKVARYVYARAAENGKRAQCGGGAKNPLVILPDADLETTIQIVTDSAFGNAGQRCLAASLVITVGDMRKPFTEAVCEAARKRIVGYGLDKDVQMGPVISQESKRRLEGFIDRYQKFGGKVLVDGRNPVIDSYPDGYFLRPTVLDDVPVDCEIASTELFGPVLGLMHVETLEQAIQIINQSRYGNMASIFTRDGSSARKFRYEVQAGNIGVNIGVAAPMAFFPFSGWKESFFGDMHGQAMDAVDFFTQKKVVVERWPKDWSRKF